MDKYNVNFIDEDNTFATLNIKNQFEVNAWISENKSKFDHIDNDYLVFDLIDIDNKYSLEQNIDLIEFIKVNDKKIKQILDEGLIIYVNVYDEDTEIIYKGRLSIEDYEHMKFTIIDDYDNSISISNYNNLKVDCMVLKLISKNPKYPTVKEFISKIKDNTLLYNTKINMTLKAACPNVEVINTNGEITNLDEIKKYEDTEIKFIRIIY